MQLYFNPLMATLNPQRNNPLYSNTVIGGRWWVGCYIWYIEERTKCTNFILFDVALLHSKGLNVKPNECLLTVIWILKITVRITLKMFPTVTGHLSVSHFLESHFSSPSVYRYTRCLFGSAQVCLGEYRTFPLWTYFPGQFPRPDVPTVNFHSQ